MHSQLNQTLTFSLFTKVVPYDGAICKGFIDYQVWLPDNTTVADVEGILTASGIELATSLPDPCSSIFLSYACSSAYPRPVSLGQGMHTSAFKIQLVDMYF